MPQLFSSFPAIDSIEAVSCGLFHILFESPKTSVVCNKERFQLLYRKGKGFFIHIFFFLFGVESSISTSPQGNIYKKLEHGNGETLEGQSWSPDDGIYAVLGCKAYLYQVNITDIFE